MGSRVIREATPSDLTAITALYGREVLTGTATFELDPPSLAEMTARFEAVRARGLP
jgi:phosphinothricin acetyltransferase